MKLNHPIHWLYPFNQGSVLTEAVSIEVQEKNKVTPMDVFQKFQTSISSKTQFKLKTE